MRTILEVLRNKKNLIFFLIASLLFVGSYYFTLTQQINWNVFLKNNSIPFVAAQIVLSLINSALGGLSLLIIVKIFKERRKQEKVSILQTFSALFISVVTTGCYVCGSVLLPVVGLATTFSTLPFAGLEIKIITGLFLTYSLNELLKTYKGICIIENKKIYKISFGQQSMLIKLSYFQKLKPILFTIVFIISVFTIPTLLPKNTTINHLLNNKCDGVNCSCKVNQ